MVHVRKVYPEYFEALLSGKKRFEIRQEDPSGEKFSVGDYLALNEFLPEGEHLLKPSRYSGRCLLFRISYILRASDFPSLLQPGAVVLSLELMPLSLEDLRAGR